MPTGDLFPASLPQCAPAPLARSAVPADQRGAIGQLAAAYGVGSKSDKTEENGEMARSYAARYPADRLLPMPEAAEIDPAWTSEDIEDVRLKSELLAQAEGNTTVANLWRSNLRKPPGKFFIAGTRERILTFAQRQAAIRAGEAVHPGITFDATAPATAPAAIIRQARSSTRARRRVSLSAFTPSLSARMQDSRTTVTVSWGNPYTTPPAGLPRTVWAFSYPSDDITGYDFAKAVGPVVEPGCGWCWGISTERPTRSKWSEEAKGRVRRRNLRKRLEAKVPLFAQILFEEQLARRPDYFAGKPYEATTGTPADAPDEMQGSHPIGHNGGPPLDT